MTSDEIKSRSVPQPFMPSEGLSCEEKIASASVFWLKEIAFQLAKANEGNGLDTE